MKKQIFIKDKMLLYVSNDKLYFIDIIKGKIIESKYLSYETKSGYELCLHIADSYYTNNILLIIDQLNNRVFKIEDPMNVERGNTIYLKNKKEEYLKILLDENTNIIYLLSYDKDKEIYKLNFIKEGITDVITIPHFIFNMDIKNKEIMMCTGDKIIRFDIETKDIKYEKTEEHKHPYYIKVIEGVFYITYKIDNKFILYDEKNNEINNVNYEYWDFTLFEDNIILLKDNSLVCYNKNTLIWELNFD